MKKIYLSVAVYLLMANLFLPNTFAQDYTQWHLPVGARARLGKGWVRDIEFSPYGTQLAVATTIGIWIYDVQTGTEQSLLLGIMGGANAVSYSPGGSILAAAHRDQTVRLWDINNVNNLPVTFTGHTSEIHTVTFSPDGNMLASGSADKTIRLWQPHTSIENNQLIAILPYRDTINTVDFSPGNRMIAGGSEDGTIQIWDAGTGDRIYEFEGHTDSVWAVDFSPNSQILISASLDGTIQLWDLVAPGGRLEEPTQHHTSVYAVNFSQDGSNFVTSGADQEVRVWNAHTRELTSTLEGHNDIVPTVELSPDGTTLASGSLDGTVRLWDMRLFRERLALAGHTGGIKALTYTEDNRLLACGTGLDNKLRLWDAGTGAQLSKLRDHRGLAQTVAFSKDGQTLASGGNIDGTIFVSEVSNANEDNLIAALEGNIHGITALALSPAGTTLASGGADGRIYLLDVDTGRELRILRGAQSTITALTFVVDGTHLFSGEESGIIRRWNALTGQEVWSDRGAFSAITAMAFSPNGRFLAIVDRMTEIRLFDFDEEVENRQTSIPTRHTDKITVLVFSRDSETLVSGSEDGTIILWDMRAALTNPRAENNTSREDNRAEQNITRQEHNTTEQSAQEIAKKALASTVYIRMYDANSENLGSGSGFFIGHDKIATNYHVIKGTTSIVAKLVGERQWHAVENIVATDEEHDLAILELSGIIAPALRLANSDAIQIGDSVYAVGNPERLEGTFSEGIISSIRRVGNNRWIQMTASISPGSSGGAVLNSRGQVIGIATASHPSTEAENINFAVPSNYLKALLRRVE